MRMEVRQAKQRINGWMKEIYTVTQPNVDAERKNLDGFIR
jgi:hypothetical protein